MTQLSLFDNMQDGMNSGDPLPIIVARKWNFPLAYYVIEDEYWYAVQDWIVGIIKCSSQLSAKMWVKSKTQLSTPSRQLPLKAKNGKTYQMDFVTDKGLYQLSTYMRTTKKRPVLDEIKNYLAASGVILDEQRLNPESAAQVAIGRYKQMGHSDEWIEARLNGVVTRKYFCAAINETLYGADNRTYAVATDTLYVRLLAYTTAQLKELLGLKPRQNVRDFMGRYALAYIGITEWMIGDKLKEKGNDDIMTLELITEIIADIATFIRQQYETTQAKLGMDLITERKLLKG